MNDAGSLNSAMEGVHVVIHAAAYYGHLPMANLERPIAKKHGASTWRAWKMFCLRVRLLEA